MRATGTDRSIDEEQPGTTVLFQLPMSDPSNDTDADYLCCSYC
jgi:hypothetical protein